MNQIYSTNNIIQNLNFRILTFITDQISNIRKTADYLQVFEVKGDTLIHSSEKPKYEKNYPLGRKYDDCKIFAMRTDELKRSYWTVMFAEDY